MKKIVKTEAAPQAIGPYSQAVQANGFLFTAGQLPVNPATGEMPEGIAAQTEQALENIRAVLKASGVGMDAIVKVTVFLSDMNNFSAMNEVYATFFSEGNYPARCAVEVSRLPKDALLEIEAIAAI